MKIKITPFQLSLTHQWAIASDVKTGGKTSYGTVFLELEEDGVIGLGEAAPSSRYQENTETVTAFLKLIDPKKLSFDNLDASLKYLEQVAPGNYAGKTAVNIALLDGAARKKGQAIYDFLGLGFTEKKHLTSFTIGIDKPEMIRKKVCEAAIYPILKLKVGGPDDRLNLAALRDAAPTKTVRVDGNEGWKTKEEALENIEWFAKDGHVEYVEQPMPASSNPKDLMWLKERSPLPLFGDESYHHASDVNFCADCFHGVNVKLIKTGGISGGFEALQAARKAGLKTMVGCMIESSIEITAAAHLAELTDHFDIDGNILISNDPYLGVTSFNGMLSFAQTPEKIGLRVRAR
ncbi:MAG: dipeptide epimerase [Limisphaerales bacterium]